MNPRLKPEIEVFDQMAPGWYSFRHYSIFRNELERLAKSWQKGRLLNIGCGHGADFLPFTDQFELTGMDFSAEMIKMARRYSHKFEFQVNLQVADARHLPFASKSFDFAIAVATYHHLKGRDDQLAALTELKRVLKPGGQAFITVWNHSQPRFWFKRSEVGMPWKAKGQVVQRYYYLFNFWSFEGLVKKAGFQIIKSAPESQFHFPLKYFARNICLTVKREE
jgi:tRNA (uracil-5-)-methyltransferase TRM9